MSALCRRLRARRQGRYHGPPSVSYVAVSGLSKHNTFNGMYLCVRLINKGVTVSAKLMLQSIKKNSPMHGQSQAYIGPITKDMVEMVAHAITAASGACSLGSSGRLREMATRVVMVLMVQGALCEQFRRDPSLIDRLSHGMKFATDFLGSESVATKVAEFVVRAFQVDKPPHKRPLIDAYADHSSEESSAYENRPNSNVDEAPNPLAPLKYLVRLFGLQPSQISAVAVNALVFVAQMISTFLSGNNRPSRPYRAEDPKEWILNKNSRRLQDLLSKAKNESLFEDIEQIIKEQASDEDTSCIRLLVCKITPFVHKMQEAVFGKEPESHKAEKLRGAAIMYRHLPSAGEINARSDICERRHADCELNE